MLENEGGDTMVEREGDERVWLLDAGERGAHRSGDSEEASRRECGRRVVETYRLTFCSNITVL